MRFCQRDRRTGRIKRRRLDMEPSPTICANGMGDSLAGGYWLEDDGMTKRKKKGSLSRRHIDLDRMPSPTISAGGVSNDNTSHYWIEGDPARPAGGGGKPPYRVPSMAEITAVPKNGYSVVSTFSGCGGSCLGYCMAGFQVLWANEFEPNAAECHKLNFPGCVLDTRDIRAVQPEEILAAIGLRAEELDLLDGSPPFGVNRKADSKRPSPTVTTQSINLTHFSEKRKFTIAELKRICSFSDDFLLVGSYAKQWARLGNSVPPRMMFEIAKVIKERVLDRTPADSA